MLNFVDVGVTSLPNCAAGERQVTECASIRYGHWDQKMIEKDEYQLFATRISVKLNF